MLCCLFYYRILDLYSEDFRFFFIEYYKAGRNTDDLWKFVRKKILKSRQKIVRFLICRKIEYCVGLCYDKFRFVSEIFYLFLLVKITG